MRFYGAKTLTAYFPVNTRVRAIWLVRTNQFVFSNGLVGSAVYLYMSKNLAFVLGEWAIECRVSFYNLAGISLHKKEFDELFEIPYKKEDSWEIHNVQQRRVNLYAGYDGFILDSNMLAVFGSIRQIHAIKASPKPNEVQKVSSYNKFLERVKTISKVFSRRTHGNPDDH